MNRFCVATLFAVGAAGCGDGTGPDTGAIGLDGQHAVTLRIGSTGGTITTTDGAGRTYLLTIPALALRDSVDVTLTPVASYDLPAGVSLLAAAHFAPEGLRLAVPARLAIVVPGGAPGAAGFGYSGHGDSLHLDLLGHHGDTLFIPVRHFSGAGAAATTDIGLLTPSLASGAAVQAYLDLESLTQEGRSSGTYDAQALAQVLSHWATSVVIPGLNAASSEQTLLDAVARYDDWTEVLDCGADVCAGTPLHLWPETVRLDVVGHLLQEYSDARLALAHALKAGIDRLMEQCTSGHDLQAAGNSLYWEGLALAHGAEDLVRGLDADAFFAGFCVRVIFESVTLPGTLATGTPASVQVKAGLSFGGGPADHTTPLAITLSVSNAAPATLSGVTTAGVYTAPIVPTGTSPLFLGVHGALTSGQLDQLAQVAHDTTYQQAYGNVSLTPVAAILDPGAEARFTANVTGLSSAAVTWSATGGTLSGTSGTGTTYTAGGAAGTYQVTATSVADPTQRATARIEIVAPGSGGGGIVTDRAYFHLTATVDPGPVGAACDTTRDLYTAVGGDSETCAETLSTGSAQATVQYQYTQTHSTPGTSQFHFTSTGSAGVSSAGPETTELGAAYATYSGYFDVNAPSATFETYGTLTNSDLDSGDGNAVMLTTRDGPGGATGAIIGVFCKGTSTVNSYCPQASRDEGHGDKTWAGVALTLAPGRYYIDISNLARAQLPIHVTPGQALSSTAATDVTITLTQH